MESTKFDKLLCHSKAPVIHYEGRWYITMGQPGFNSPANNRWGYVSERAARAAIRRYGAAR